MCRSVPAVVQVYKSEDKFVDSFSSTTWVPGIELKLLCLLESTLVPWASSPTLCQTFAFVPLTLNFATRNLVCVFCSCCVCCCCCFYSNRFTLLTPNNLLSSSLLVSIYHIFFGWFSFSFFWHGSHRRVTCSRFQLQMSKRHNSVGFGQYFSQVVSHLSTR